MNKCSSLLFLNSSDNSNLKIRQKKKRTCQHSKTYLLVGLALCMSLLVTLLNIYQLQQLKEERLPHAKGGIASKEEQSETKLRLMKEERLPHAKGGVSSIEEQNVTKLRQKKENPILHIKGGGSSVNGHSGMETKTSPVVWIHGGKNLDEVRTVFKGLGFVVTSSGDANWDVLWSYEYPFSSKLSKYMHNLRPHQKVNHFPGCGFITNKVKLATLELDAIPKAFRLPQDKNKLLTYAGENQSVKWIQKNNNHRGIYLKKIEELDFKSNGVFVQEFVANPYLIDGRMFDISVYAIMTSVNPLRVYIMNDETQLRFCTKDYYPFDESDLEKYTRTRDYLNIWQMPSFQGLYVDQKFGVKESFDRHMINKGINIDKIWADIHDIIRTVYLKQQPLMMSVKAKYNTTKNFFELVRFDSILDDKLKVHLMEVNMSPSLDIDGQPKYIPFYHKIIYNVLRLTGVASLVENHFHHRDSDMKNMQASDRDVTVFSEWCTSSQCKQCDNMKCSMCRQCMKPQQIEEYKDAYIEHINRGSCRRMFPPRMNQTDAVRWDPDQDSFGLSRYSDSNRKMYVWFIGMCRKDETFCS